MCYEFQFIAFDGYSFVVGDGDGKYGVGPSTTHVYFWKVDFRRDCSDFLSYQSRYYPSVFYSNKCRYFFIILEEIG